MIPTLAFKLLDEIQTNRYELDRIGILADCLDDSGNSLGGTVRIVQHMLTCVGTNKCPKCSTKCYWRSGVHFEHQLRCPKCEYCFEPQECFDQIIEEMVDLFSPEYGE
jgi:hypothetical protein